MDNSIIDNLILRIKQQADSIADGWISLEVPECEETKAEAFTLKLPRIPFERWLRNARLHRFGEWTNVSPLGLKMHMDDRNHSDWWLMTGIPIEYTYGRKRMRMEDYLCDDDPDFIPRPANEDELIAKVKRINNAAWNYRFDSTDNRERNSIFLVSSRKEIEGFVFHVNTDEDILKFVDEAVRWKKAFNHQHVIAVIPDCSVKYDLVIRHAGAIITSVGSAAAHVVKVAREDKVPVILCPDAFNEYFNGERVKIVNKKIRSCI